MRDAIFMVPAESIGGNLGDLFPAYIPNCEIFVYQRVLEATQTHLTFPSDGGGIPLPATFNGLPAIGLYADTAEDGASPTGRPSAPIPVTRGWPAYPGKVPAIGVAMGADNEDQASKSTYGGFAGDVTAVDVNGDPVAGCAYYADPRYASVIVELIHENRDERDRLHDQLRRVLYPLRHILPAASPLIKEVTVNAEKQDLPHDEGPLTIYVSVITVEMWSEALLPTEVVSAADGGFINSIAVTVDPLDPSGVSLGLVVPAM